MLPGRPAVANRSPWSGTSLMGQARSMAENGTVAGPEARQSLFCAYDGENKDPPPAPSLPEVSLGMDNGARRKESWCKERDEVKLWVVPPALAARLYPGVSRLVSPPRWRKDDNNPRGPHDGRAGGACLVEAAFSAHRSHCMSTRRRAHVALTGSEAPSHGEMGPLPHGVGDPGRPRWSRHVCSARA